jgi:hypothetical protein
MNFTTETQRLTEYRHREKHASTTQKQTTSIPALLGPGIFSVSPCVSVVNFLFLALEEVVS